MKFVNPKHKTPKKKKKYKNPIFCFPLEKIFGA